jgi:Domain of unknown function (DUF4157)
MRHATAKKSESLTSDRTRLSRVSSNGLKVGRSGGASVTEANPGYETTADSKAVPEWSLSGMSIEAPLQRKCSCDGSSHGEGECEECKAKSALQRMSTNAGTSSVTPLLLGKILSSPGQPLDRDTRAFMETGFLANLTTTTTASPTLRRSGMSEPSDPAEVEADRISSRVIEHSAVPSKKENDGPFSNVRIHINSEAGRSAQAVSAHAYTVGNHIVFAPGKYSPQTLSGKRLLAHELTHVVQQQKRRSNTISRFKVTDCDPKDPVETPTSVSDAHKLAVKMLQAANTAVNGGPPTPAIIAAAAKHFKITLPANTNTDKKNWARARFALSTMLQADSNATYECEPKQNWWNGGCISGVEAISLFNIHLCPLWWKDHPTTLERASILVHEWGHKWGKGVNRISESYRFDKDYAALSAEKRLGLPDAYMAFVFELWTGSPPSF